MSRDKPLSNFRVSLTSRASLTSTIVSLYYRSGTDGRCCIGAGQQTLRVHLLYLGSALLRKWRRHDRYLLKVWLQIKNPIPSTDAYKILQEQFCQKCHRHPRWNDGAFVFLRGRSPHPNKNKNSNSGVEPCPHWRHCTVDVASVDSSATVVAVFDVVRRL